MTTYNHVCDRPSYVDFGINEIIKEPLQKQSSDLSGLYCIYIAHYVFSAYFPLIPYITEEQLLRFVNHLS